MLATKDSGALLRFAQGPNMVDLKEGERALKEKGRYAELVALYKSRGSHNAALSILKAVSLEQNLTVSPQGRILFPQIPFSSPRSFIRSFFKESFFKENIFEGWQAWLTIISSFHLFIIFLPFWPFQYPWSSSLYFLQALDDGLDSHFDKLFVIKHNLYGYLVPAPPNRFLYTFLYMVHLADNHCQFENFWAQQFCKIYILLSHTSLEIWILIDLLHIWSNCQVWLTSL